MTDVAQVSGTLTADLKSLFTSKGVEGARIAQILDEIHIDVPVGVEYSAEIAPSQDPKCTMVLVYPDLPLKTSGASSMGWYRHSVQIDYESGEVSHTSLDEDTGHYNVVVLHRNPKEELKGCLPAVPTI